MKTFDVLIIGAGSAGISAAEAAKESGAASVAIVESAKRLGGECPNWGCVPTKVLLRTGEVADLLSKAETFGVQTGRMRVDFSSVMHRKTRIVNALTGKGRLKTYLKRIGVTQVRGEAVFLGAHEVCVNRETYRAGKIIVAIGAEPVAPPIEGLKEAGFWTSDDIVSLKKAPTSLCIIGGGPIGVEMAQIFQTFGTRVTIVESASQLLPREESDVADLVKKSFKKQGIKLLLSHQVRSVAKNARGYEVRVATGKKKEVVVRAAALLVATGKHPPFSRLQIKKAGVRADEHGYPILNPYLQSSNPDVYFAGDATGQMMFTHVAHEHGTVAGTNAVRGQKRISDLRVVPRGTFCRPEIGSVGLTTVEAKQKGLRIRVGKVPFVGMGKALVSGEQEGFVKILVDQ